MAKISIIDVDLGTSVDEIINGKITQLTSKNMEELDNAVEQSKRVQVLLDKQQLQKIAKKNKDEETTKLLQDIATRLIQAPIIASEIHNMISNHIVNMSAFTTRMKTLLRNDGNKYVLKKYTEHGCQYYTLTPCNLEVEEPAEQFDE